MGSEPAGRKVDLALTIKPIRKFDSLAFATSEANIRGVATQAWQLMRRASAAKRACEPSVHMRSCTGDQRSL